MNILIIYDSFFGNTEKVAFAMRDALQGNATVKCLRIHEATRDMLKDINFLIVGSPTRGFRPTKPIVQFLDKLPADILKDVKVAAFDTRIDVPRVNSRFLHFMVRIFGYAAQPIASRLARKGGVTIAPPAGFIVKESEGPLEDGELERAASWAKEIAGK